MRRPLFRWNRFGAIFLFLGVVLGGYAIAKSGWWLLLLWPAISMILAGLAYFFFGARLFCKTPQGMRRVHARVVFFPYCLANWLGWRGVRIVSKEACWNEAAPNLYIGRRAYGHELPDELELVVDLTAEFNEPKCVRGRARYLALPTLDASVPDIDDEVFALVSEINNCPGGVYIHCAEGHGRAAMLTVLVLMSRKLHADTDSAVAHLRTCRPKINLRPWQMRTLRAWELRLKEKESAVSPA